MMKHDARSFPLFFLAVLLGALIAWAEPARADRLYVVDGDGRRYYVIDSTTGAVLNAWTHVTPDRTFPIAVSADIRTTGYATGETGAQYTLGGLDLGGRYPLPGGLDTLSDGTTDGRFNYAIGWSSGRVYRFDRNWANPVPIFHINAPFSGISYDATDSTLWVSSDRTRIAPAIRHYTLSGALLGSFPVPQVGSCDWNLALNPADGTLWIGQTGTTTWHRYTRTGTYLGPLAMATPTAFSFFSAEFEIPPCVATVLPAAVPTLALQGLGAGQIYGNVAYDFVRDRYYSGQLGTNTLPIQVWDGAGALLQTANPTNFPWRGFHYNPNTGNVEFTTFDAVSGNGVSTGLFALGRDGAGLYLEPNTPVTFPLPGILSGQPCPTYDPVLDVLYSQRDGFGTVEMVDHATGMLVGSIPLDLAAAGTSAGAIQGDVIGFDEVNRLLVTVEVTGSRALVFDLGGAFVGACALPVVPPGLERFDIGYANRQLFVHAAGATTYQAFRILQPCDLVPPVVTCTIQRTILYPARNGLMPVGLAVTATDDSGVPPTVQVRVYSDEPVGSPPYAPDAMDSGGTWLLRAERSATGNGRVYLVVVKATDGAGNVSYACCTATVPLLPTTYWILQATAEANAARLACEASGTGSPGAYTLVSP